MKLKDLLPSLREKKRYIAFEAVGRGEISQKDANGALMSELQRFIGELGMARAGVILLKDWHKNRGIVRVAHTQVDIIKSVILLAKGRDFMFRTLAVSGSLNKLRKKIRED